MDKALSGKIANFSFACACAVVAQHLMCDFPLNTFWGFLSSTVFNGVCQIAVPYFFTVSGYFLAQHFDDAGWWGGQVGKRLRSILIPFLIWNLAWFGFGACLAFGADGGSFGKNLQGVFSLHQFLRMTGVDFCSKPLLINTWYLRSLLILVFVSPLLKVFVRRCGLWAIAFLYVANWAYPPSFVSADMVKIFFTYSLSLTGLLYFSVGIYLANFQRNWQVTRRQGVALVAFAMLLLFVRYGLRLKYGWQWLLVYVPLVYIPVLLIGLWHCFPNVRLLTLSRDSFALYLVHQFPIVIYGVVTRNVSTTGSMIGQLVFVYGISLALVEILRRVCPRVLSVVLGGR